MTLARASTSSQLQYPSGCRTHTRGRWHLGTALAVVRTSSRCAASLLTTACNPVVNGCEESATVRNICTQAETCTVPSGSAAHAPDPCELPRDGCFPDIVLMASACHWLGRPALTAGVTPREVYEPKRASPLHTNAGGVVRHITSLAKPCVVCH